MSGYNYIYQVAIGSTALLNCKSGADNVAIGYPAAEIYKNFDRYVILSYHKDNRIKSDLTLYYYYDKITEKLNAILIPNMHDYYIESAIIYYHTMLPKWLLLYQLYKDDGIWRDIFRYHLLPHYFD